MKGLLLSAQDDIAADLPPCTPAPLTLLAVMPTMPRADRALTTFGNRHGLMMACMHLAVTLKPLIYAQGTHLTLALPLPVQPPCELTL